jgi:flagellar FliL protein
MIRKLIPFIALFISFISFPTFAEDEAAAAPKATYFNIDEPFTINFLHQSDQKVRYMQIRVALMSFDQDVITNAEENLPMIQDALRTLFSEQTLEAVNSVDGRKQLQASALESLQTLLKEETGNGDLEGVYFTSFVLQ